MTPLLNLHKLMSTDAGYLNALKVATSDRETLTVAREIIRDTLRSAFRDWEQHVTRAEMYDSIVAKAAELPPVPVPKFRIQGSFAYHTANDCQSPPDQQIDQDDGVFLPLTFLSVNGRARPTIASKAYFKVVEQALAPLCERRGWKLNPGRKKGSCVRVEISDRLHIDLPLYAIRDESFQSLVEVAAATQLKKSIEVRDARELDEQIYENLADAEIILAHRTEGWIESDPRKLEDWFKSALTIHGEIARLLSRSFKGLRDAKFNEGLSSICIMALVVKALDALGGVDDKRLDLALVDVAKTIANIIDEPVNNPAFPDDAEKRLCKDWMPEFRNDVRALFQTTADTLATGIYSTYVKSLAVSRARQAFGERVPEDEALVQLAGVAAAVRQTPPAAQPVPLIPRTKSG